MDCKEMEEIILTDYIDGKIAGQALRSVEAHLASCIRCRGLASELASIRAPFRKTERMEPPSEVWERIRAEVSRKPIDSVFAQDTFQSIRLFFARLRPAIVVMTAAALILAVLTVARLMPQKGMRTPPASGDDILSLVTSDENENGALYDFGTPAENYFL